MCKYSFLTAVLLVCAAFGSASASEKPKYRDANAGVDERVADLLSRMTLDEKVAQMRHLHHEQIMTDGCLDKDKLAQVVGSTGVGFVEGITWSGEQCCQWMGEIQQYMRGKTRLGIPAFTSSESLHGSVQDGSTIFPQAIALGSTWNTELARLMAEATAAELKAQGITQTLAPVVDVCRDPRWGRVEECLGEDPHLISRMAAPQVRSYLDAGISPMLKHFGAHGSPQGGINLASVSCGERDLLGVYMATFEYVIKTAQPWAVMSSYDSWNGIPNSGSHFLLTDLLRNQWGFKGFVYSDWGAIGMLNHFHHTAANKAEAAVQALEAGLDAEAADNCYSELPRLVREGVISEDLIDLAVSRILRAKFSMGLFDNPIPEIKDYARCVHTNNNVNLAREIANESIVLLENKNNILPLNAQSLKSIALIGPNADQVQFGDYSWTRSNNHGITLLQAMQARIGDKVTVRYARGCDLTTQNRDGFAEAVEAARLSDVSIVVVGTQSASLAREYKGSTCGEGYDLNSLELCGVQQQLIEAVHATGKPVIVVLLSGRPFALQWVKQNIPGVIVQWYPGEEGGNALADVILGKVNPSGKLNYSFPKSTGHLPCYYNHLPTDRGFYHNPGDVDRPGQDYVFSSPDALWSFGRGLSYTKFAYDDATVNKTQYAEPDTIAIDVKLRNAGTQRGKEVVQVYVRDVVSSVVTPVKQLKAFAKVDLAAGEVRTVRLAIPVADLALYNREMRRVVEPGEFELQIGSASDDIRITRRVTVMP
ncbi:MAG: glycoside hydrolase family 3 N-terminal domain-containing protein [Muribaculaceae bacterium]